MNRSLSQFLVLFGVCGAAFFAAYAPRDTARTPERPGAGVSAATDVAPLGSARVRAAAPSAPSENPLPAQVGNPVKAIRPEAIQPESIPAESLTLPREASGEAATDTNPYSFEVRQQAMERLLPPSDAPLEQRIAEYREKKFKSYLQQAERSRAGTIVSGDASQASGQYASDGAHEDGASASATSDNPYAKLKATVAEVGAPEDTPEAQAAEAVRKADRFASYVENAERSNR